MARPAGLAYADVLKAAVEIADREGLEHATPARVAHKLELRLPSLYHWFDGAGGLRRSLALEAATRLGEALRSAEQHADPKKALRNLALVYREFARAHPGLYQALLPAPREKEDPELYLAFGAVAITVGNAVKRLRPTQLIRTVRAFRSLVHGFADLERGGGFAIDNDLDRSFEFAIDLFLDAL